MFSTMTASARFATTIAVSALLLTACGDDTTQDTTDAPSDASVEDADADADAEPDGDADADADAEPDEADDERTSATASWNDEDLGLDDVDCRDNAAGVWLFADGSDGSDIEIQWESAEHLDSPVRVQLAFPADGADATIGDGETYQAGDEARGDIATGEAAVSGSLELAADEDTQADPAGGTLEIEASCVDALDL